MASELPSNGDGIASGSQWKVAHPKVESVFRYVAKVPAHGVIGELLQWKICWELLEQQ